MDDNWIDVNDRLPGDQGMDSEDVLVFMNGHCDLRDYDCRNGGPWGMEIGFYDAEKGVFRTGGRLDLYVTHWQPLPGPPKTVKDQ